MPHNETTASDYIYGYDTELVKGYVKSLDGVLLKEWDGLAPTSFFEPNEVLFCNGLAVLWSYPFVQENDSGVYHLMDRDFNIIKGAKVDGFSLEWFRRYLCAWVDGKLGFLNGKGDWKLPPIYDRVEGDADYDQWRFLIVQKDGFWGVLGLELEEILPCDYLEIVAHEVSLAPHWTLVDGVMQPLQGSYAGVCRVKGRNGKYGVLSFCQRESESSASMAFTGCIYTLNVDEIQYDDTYFEAIRDGVSVYLSFETFWKIEERSAYWELREAWELRPLGCL